MLLHYSISHLMYLTPDLQVCSVARENMLHRFWGKNRVLAICYQIPECLILLRYRSLCTVRTVNTMLASVQKNVVASFQEHN